MQINSRKRGLHWGHAYHPRITLLDLNTMVSNAIQFQPSLPELSGLICNPSKHTPDPSYSHLNPPQVCPQKLFYFILPGRSICPALESSSLPTFSDSVDCNLIINYLTTNIQLQVIIYHICLYRSELPNSGIFSCIIPLSVNFMLFFSS